LQQPSTVRAISTEICTRVVYGMPNMRQGIDIRIAEAEAATTTTTTELRYNFIKDKNLY